MKSFVVNKLVDNIKKHFNYTDTKLLELKYGIEVIYLTITKTIVIVLLALLLGVFKELLFILLFYSILRATGFGVHAQKAWHCWLSSIVIFLGVPILLSYAQALPTPILIILSSLFLLLIFIFAPADTEKRPIVSRKRRMIYKTMCSLTALTYSIIIVFILLKII